MAANPVRRATTLPDDLNLAALTKLAAASQETMERDRDLTIAGLEALALRYATAINNISQGVCFFDGEQRLILSNRRYAEIYRLAPERVHLGATLREIVQLRLSAGTAAMAVEDYLAMTASFTSNPAARIWTAELKDGRSIAIHHQPMADGGWVATHEDITELKATRSVADERISLQALIDWVPDYLWVKDTASRFVVVNKALAMDAGRAKTSDLIGLSDFDLHAPEAAREFLAIEQEILRSGRPMVDREEFFIDASGAKRWLLSTKVPLRNDRDEIVGLVGIARDITQRKLSDALRDGQAQILEMIATSAPLEDVLDHLMRLVESQLSGIFGSVLLLDKKKSARFRHGAAPSLPADYLKTFDGVRVGPDGGAIAAAAYRRETIIVADITHEPQWEEGRAWAAAHGLRSCWSTPILAHHGAALGVIAIYSTTAREPTAAETRIIDFATRIAGIAIERKAAEDRIASIAKRAAGRSKAVKD